MAIGHGLEAALAGRLAPFSQQSADPAIRPIIGSLDPVPPHMTDNPSMTAWTFTLPLRSDATKNADGPSRTGYGPSQADAGFQDLVVAVTIVSNTI